MRALVWLFRAFIFFSLFAFALNNQQSATVHWFFSYQWQAPMVIVVLAAFAAGALLGVLALVPAWWRLRQASERAASTPPLASDATGVPDAAAGAESSLAYPRTDGI